jgi:FkbM family methyltransferase
MQYKEIINGAVASLIIVPGGVFVDVGANLGLHPIIFADWFKSVIAFETNPIIFKVREANVALKDIKNVCCVCSGVSSENRNATFYIPRNGNLSRGTLNPWDVPSGVVEVQVQLDTLDNILMQEESEKVSLLKIDVEGHEANVLNGASHTLERSGSIVLFEVLDTQQGRACVSILRQHGYTRFMTFGRKPDSSTAYAKAFFSSLAIAVADFDESKIGVEALVCAVKPPEKPFVSTLSHRANALLPESCKADLRPFRIFG